MAAGKKQYVYRLMKAKCSCGDQKFEQNLNLPLDHGVSIYSHLADVNLPVIREERQDFWQIFLQWV